MGRRKLQILVGALKDKASQTKSSLICTAAIAAFTPIKISPDLAVLRATPHHPPDEPPNSRHLNTLLSFGSAPRPVAAALVSSLTSRLCSTRDAAVALKSLLALRHVAIHGAFILRDQLSSSLRCCPGNRNPLLLSSFRDASSQESWALSSWVRWFARVLELLVGAPTAEGEDLVSSLLTDELLRETNSLVELVQEMRRGKPFPTWEGNALVGELVRVVHEDRLTAEDAIRVRVQEAAERLGSMEYADSVELVCLLRRLEETKEKDKPSDVKYTAADLLWDEIKEVRNRAEQVVGKMEMDRGRRIRRERAGESDRIRNGSILAVQFRSHRWADRRQGRFLVFDYV